MENEGPRVKFAKKIYSPPKDKPKRKSKPKKDTESKASETKIADDTPKIDTLKKDASDKAELAQYVYKLQHQLNFINKELKFEQSKYKDFIRSMSSFLTAHGEDLSENKEFERFLAKGETGEHVSENNFEKLFTTCKYDINGKKDGMEPDNDLELGSKGRGHKGSRDFTNTKSKRKDTELSDNPVVVEKSTDQNKKSKKRKPSNIEEEESEHKVKKPKKNKAIAENNQSKEDPVASRNLESITIESEKSPINEADNTLRKAEDIINQYEGLTQRSLQNNQNDDEVTFLPQPSGLDVAQLLNQQFTDGNNGMQSFTIPPLVGEDNEQNRLSQEALQLTLQDLMRMGLNPTQSDLLNYYKMNFK